MSKVSRAKRSPPARSGPIRSVSTAFRPPSHQGGGRERGVIGHAVETAYRVIDEYMLQGAEAARWQRPHPSTAGDAMKNDTPSTAAAAAMQSWASLAQMWFGAMAPGMWGMATPRGAVPGMPPGVPPWMGMPWMAAWQSMAMPWAAMMAMPWMAMQQGAMGAPCGPPANGAGFGGGFGPGTYPGFGGGFAPTAVPGPEATPVALVVEGEKAEVMVDLWDRGTAARPLEVRELGAVGCDEKMPASAVSFRHVQGKLVVRVEIPEKQKPGPYAGAIVDRETGVEQGRMHILVHDRGR